MEMSPGSPLDMVAALVDNGTSLGSVSVIRIEILPFIGVASVLGALVVLAAKVIRGCRWKRALAPGLLVAGILCAYLLCFFRDPPRHPPADPYAVAAGAEGRVAGIAHLTPEAFKSIATFNGLAGDDLDAFVAGDVVRIGIFLSLFDVHVNRAPIAGESRFLGYFKGKHFFTFKEKSSEENQHNSILIVGDRTCCLVNQIVGPVARRVVYWLDKTRAVPVEKGDKIGMMKFGSRLDMYFPADDVTIEVDVGDRVRAGETVVARERVEGGI